MKYLPIYVDERTGLAAFSSEGFRMVVEGYKCAQCWEEFTMYTPKCPVCGCQRDLEKDLQELPRHWETAPDESLQDPDAPTKTKPRPFVHAPLDRTTAAALENTGWNHDPVTGKRRWRAP